eukprot:sb/3476521/
MVTKTVDMATKAVAMATKAVSYWLTEKLELRSFCSEPTETNEQSVVPRFREISVVIAAKHIYGNCTVTRTNPSKSFAQGGNGEASVHASIYGITSAEFNIKLYISLHWQKPTETSK